ncbi:MAG: hypothetical protein DMF53_27095 [Acidobacteria bacterium]|nr:MAG: hypothetical protein DMF53_27095 [Acidobacteriota bacterium]
MSKPIQLSAFSNRRVTLLGVAILMTLLAMVSIQTRPAFASGCLQYCSDWFPVGDCCGFYAHQYRQCTDGVGNYCTEYRCAAAACAT